MNSVFQFRVLTCLLFLSLFQQILSRKFVRKREFDGYMCNNEDIAFERNISSAIKCAELCLRSKSCLDIYYVRDTMLCVGCKIWYSEIDTRRMMPGSKCYEKRRVCPEDTIRKWGRSCYIKPEKQYMDFWDAKHYCLHLGAHIVQPETAEENAFLLTFFDTYTEHEIIWIGLSDWKFEGQWRWQSTGFLAPFKGWYPPEPNGGLWENCAGFKKNQQYWHDYSCPRKDTLTICEKRIEE